MKRSGLRGIRLFLAVSASVVSACVCVLLIAGEYHSARFNLDTHEREYQGWQACRRMKPAYYQENKEAVSSCLKSLEAARDDFWIKRSTVQLAALFLIAGLGSAAGGYWVTWGLIWLIGVGLHEFARWWSFRAPPKTKRPLDCQPPLQTNVSAECR